uniref:Uncharacterized protein n=1 Tax=Helicotheca tamesis TaxID=374047 RepID=A0A7S2MUC4_9STRA|mmetsp:Transcript_3517/g.4761  ORF Transcript_3517/g.4761 Transcript_3517/m.4761 type:complete len:284 (+) Transcript_3517:116-967(+)|eukprot:CAMPEP_0185739902 /NCGR_PEP_ID=MMETSP1171-20130828/36494_1 /TAXON_ID=374046 /ORGANISM="Helicotheca tamensis, Strain CCMP826" /LENGTH=283 /DNA_ID=CAMNT_0028411599 /DNA_START=50 /DNA_END=901 /DNA_ORIENTATION=-
MVVISVKNADGDGFLFETTTQTKNDDLIRSLANIQNDRLRSRVVIDAARGLATHGPMKKPQEAGLDEVKENIVGEKIEKGPNYTADPTGVRTGNAPDSKLAETLDRVARDLEEYIDKSQVQKRIALTEEELRDKIANVRGAVMMAYPMGLPEWDTVKLALDSVDNLKGTSVGNEVLDPNNTSLWVAGKEFERGQLVSDRLGKNEKTKVIAKLQPKGSGPPGREPVVSEEEQKAMMAHYFKRQEELKRLAESEDDDYLNSQWADSKEMKRNLQGLGNVQAPGFR